MVLRHWSRFPYKEIVGVPPAEYVIMLRLEQVRRKLEETPLSLYEIAAENGFPVTII